MIVIQTQKVSFTVSNKTTIMETKTIQAVSQFKSGNLSASLKIFKTFKMGFTKEEQRTIQIASESLSGKSTFYQQLGINTKEIIAQSESIIRTKYNLN